MKKSLQVLAVLAAVYFIVFGIRVYWFTQKNGFHVDEGMTLALSSYKEYIISKNYEYEREYTGKEIKELSLAGNETFTDAAGDIKSLWKDNRDSPHTNLYYTLLRISLVGLKSAEIKPIVFRGAVLNLILFTISFVFFFLLIRKLFPDSSLLQYSAVLCAFLSAASISNTMFLRPYQIQETMFIIFMFLFIKTIDLENNIFAKNNRFVMIKQIFFLAVITGITLLTGYYAVIYIGLLGIYVIYIKCRERRFFDLLFYILVLILGIIIACILYPKYIDGFSSYRGMETIKTVSADVIVNIRTSMAAALSLLNTYFFSFAVIIVCLLCAGYIIFYKQKLIIKKHELFIFIIAFLYFLITLIIAPYKVLRYGMPVFPLFIILPIILINSMLNISGNLQQRFRRKISAIAIVLLCFSFLTGALNKNKIENIFTEKQAQYVFAKEASVPVYIYMFYYEKWNYVATWKYGNLVPYLNNEQKYYFIKDYEELSSSPFNDFYIVAENIPHLEEFNISGYEIIDRSEISTGEPETPSGIGNYFICFKVRRAGQIEAN
jgi:hypothetical protein